MKITHRLALATALVLLPAYVHAAPAAASAAPNDAQIAAIVVAANQVDIDAGKLATANSADSSGIRCPKRFGKGVMPSPFC